MSIPNFDLFLDLPVNLKTLIVQGSRFNQPLSLLPRKLTTLHICLRNEPHISLRDLPQTLLELVLTSSNRDAEEPYLTRVLDVPESLIDLNIKVISRELKVEYPSNLRKFYGSHMRHGQCQLYELPLSATELSLVCMNIKTAILSLPPRLQILDLTRTEFDWKILKPWPLYLHSLTIHHQSEQIRIKINI